MKLRFPSRFPWLKKISKRELILAGVTLAVLSFLAAESGVRAVHRDFSRLDARIREREATLFAYKSALAGEKGLEKTYKETVEHYTGLADSDRLLSEIGMLAAEQNLNIIHMKPSQPRTRGNYRGYTIEVRVQDDVERFSAFLFSLTDRLKRVGVRRLQMRGKGENALAVIDIELNALAFKR
ncbi:MAG: hypothetical protein MJA29_05310 [Candidatus Omnitrophica bacterium]|nr:hypothetical protein [Candidatus Omnitrophota bacterium]